MPTFLGFTVLIVMIAGLAGCTCTDGGRKADGRSTQAIAHEAHEAYVSAINSNNLETLMAVLTDDVVFMAPNEPRLVGKPAVRAWAEPYLQGYKLNWKKTTLEFVVAGDWAFEQYAYESADEPRGGGEPLRDKGKGINVYRRGADGKWRVARDAWNSDLKPGS